MKTKKFTSQEAYEAWAESTEGYEMIPAVVDNGWKINADMETECKSWKTALRRFAKAFAGIQAIEEWLPGVQECCESGTFEHTSTWGMTPEEAREDTKYGSYAWGIENIYDDLWYVYLVVSGGYAGRERNEDAAAAA